MEANDDDDKSRFRCLGAARYVLAAVITVLVMFIALNTVKVILRPSHGSPYLSVVGGSIVYVRRAAAIHPPALVFYLAIGVTDDRSATAAAATATGRKYYYLVNSTVYLQDQNAAAAAAVAANPERGAIVFFHPDRGHLRGAQQRAGYDILVETTVTRDAMNSSCFDMMYYKGGSFRNVTLRLEGTIVTELMRSGRNTTSSPPTRTYSCMGLSIVNRDTDIEVLKNGYGDTFCSEGVRGIK